SGKRGYSGQDGDILFFCFLFAVPVIRQGRLSLDKGGIKIWIICKPDREFSFVCVWGACCFISGKSTACCPLAPNNVDLPKKISIIPM
ncbi:hypothetical protein, partial [Paraprevotella clara]